jgi:hypothetical protein
LDCQGINERFFGIEEGVEEVIGKKMEGKIERETEK